MRWCSAVVACTTVLLLAAPSAAQTPAGSFAGPSINQWFAGGSVGAAGAEKAGGLVAAEAGIRVLPKLDVSVELGWFQNAVTRRRSGLADTLADFLADSQGQPATASVSVPTLYGAVNARYVFENDSRFRPYGLFGVGGARMSPKTTLTLGGADISGSLGQYGITLGLDLAGRQSHPAITGGAGVLMPLGKWYADAGVRLTSIRTDGQATNVSRFNVGFGARF